MMKYDNRMDPECISICDALNRIPGISTYESCCGHGEQPFRVFFRVEDVRLLSVIAYFTDACHVGFNWDCLFSTDCGMKTPPTFFIESQTADYEANVWQANRIAKEIDDFMNDKFGFEEWYNEWIPWGERIT